MRFWNWIKSLFHKPVKSIDVTQVPSNLLPTNPAIGNPALVDTGSTAHPDFVYLWTTSVIKPEFSSEIMQVCKIINANLYRYESVQNALNIPWYLVAALHYREASLDFNTYLGNGDPLNEATRHVPRGRGPFATWQIGAIDALEYDGLDKIKYIDTPKCLIEAEKFNGIGYRTHGIYSPYVWSGTNHYSGFGKYTADGHFSSTAKEDQLGVACIIKSLLNV